MWGPWHRVHLPRIIGKRGPWSAESNIWCRIKISYLWKVTVSYSAPAVYFNRCTCNKGTLITPEKPCSISNVGWSGQPLHGKGVLQISLSFSWPGVVPNTPLQPTEGPSVNVCMSSEKAKEGLSLSYIAVSPTAGHMQLNLMAGAYSNAIVFVATCFPFSMLRVF